MLYIRQNDFFSGSPEPFLYIALDQCVDTHTNCELHAGSGCEAGVTHWKHKE